MIIKHSQGEYAVRFTDITSALGTIPSEAFVITDSNVNLIGLGLERFANVFVLPAGEGTKCLECFGELIRWLARQGANRKSLVVALGGGVVGDLVGFVAAAYMRGIKYVQIPTTLLSQVDSSVGGKVAVDLPEGKNLAGAFYPPCEVFICNSVLRHLPERQFTNGMAEVLKAGFSLDRTLLDDYSAQLPLQYESEVLGELVERCIAIKARIVQEDEHELKGLRALLNFGHTVGHAIEQVTNYGPLLHGEAISIGMVAEARIGELAGITQPGVLQIIEWTLKQQGLPIHHELLGRPELLIPVMRRDKKALAGQLAFSLVTELGTSKLYPDIPESVVSEGLLSL